MYIFSGAPQWCKRLVQNHPFLHQTWCKNLGFCTKLVQKHGAICTDFCTTFCTILGCKQSFCTIFGGYRVRRQRPLSFDPPKSPHFNPLILRGLCPLKIVWGVFWDRGCFLDRWMGREEIVVNCSQFSHLVGISAPKKILTPRPPPCRHPRGS